MHHDHDHSIELYCSLGTRLPTCVGTSSHVFLYFAEGLLQDHPSLLQVPTQGREWSSDRFRIQEGPQCPDPGRCTALPPVLGTGSNAGGGPNTGLTRISDWTC